MSDPISVQIIASPVACATGVTERWREAATWVAKQLTGRFGDAVQVEYFDLFDADCPALPSDAELPVVLVHGELLSSGDKISGPQIRRRVEALLNSDEITET